jgi:hypothetical protein
MSKVRFRAAWVQIHLWPGLTLGVARPGALNNQSGSKKGR